MQTFTLTRLESDGTGTRSEIATASGVLCEALELAFHDPKIAGKTRMPVGQYPLRFHGASHFDAVYRTRVENDAQTYRGMIEIGGVPDFADILFHCGNTTKDSEGCVLCGARVLRTPGGFVIPGGESEPAFLRLYRAVSAAILGGAAALRVIDNDTNG